MTYIFYILHIHHPTFKHCQLRIYASIIVFKLSSTYQSNSCTSAFLENKKNHNFCEIKYKKACIACFVRIVVFWDVQYFCKHLTSFLHAIIQGSTNFGKWKKGVQKFRHLLMTKSNLQIINVSCIYTTTKAWNNLTRLSNKWILICLN